LSAACAQIISLVSLWNKCARPQEPPVPRWYADSSLSIVFDAKELAA
jgi:hypothetical protein